MSATERDDINVNGTRNVAEAAVASRVKRFVYSISNRVETQAQQYRVFEISNGIMSQAETSNTSRLEGSS